ncbi:MAG: 1,4-alpha-glucan branching protein GlgB [Proteobacteria bacterium]|nr:1,4-alpha-glucan branching protein GlgB [Pseudomonadota bacterium]
MKKVHPDYIKKIIAAEHHDPFSVLGMHEAESGGKRALVVRAFLPEADKAFVVAGGQPPEEIPMSKIHDSGLFECLIKNKSTFFPYTIRTIASSGSTKILHDPYCLPPVLSDYDLHLFAEGNHHKIYEKLGAHAMVHAGVAGVLFAVWAPNALRVSVVGNFNDWDGRCHTMRVRGSFGIWELFVPELAEGEFYKYEIKARDGSLITKADPYAFYSETRPKTASIVYAVDTHSWKDGKWIARRDRSDPLKQPISVYEVHLGSWMRVPEEDNRFLTYRELAPKLIAYVEEMGYTHIEFMPVLAHPYDASWGYQVTGYFSPTPRFGPPEDLMYLIDRCHQHGIGVILDWVPAHFPKDAHALAQFDGSFLYEHADTRKGEHREWGTLVFNYGRNEVRNFLISSALFWLDTYHFDGLRVDAVASMLYLDYSREPGEWVPNQFGGNENLEAIAFLKKLNEIVYRYFPGTLMIAEESTAWQGVSRPTWLGGLGFGLKWNMGWMHDTLEYFSKEPVHRKYHHHNLTFSLLYAFYENFILPFSHDEVVHGKGSLLGKMPGDVWQKFANQRLLFGYMFCHPGKKHLFMGNDIGQWSEWDHNASLDWHLLAYAPHRSLQRFVRDLNHLYRAEPALYEIDFQHSGFEWIDFHDADAGIISFIRKAHDPWDFVVVACNFTPVPRLDYRIGVPLPAFYRELLNSDSAHYGGSNRGNSGGAQADAIPWSGKPCSITVVLPPLSILIFKPEF